MKTPPREDVSQWRIMLCDEPVFAGHPLSRILDEPGFDLVTPSCHRAPWAEAGTADLVILSFDYSDASALDRLREIRRSCRARQVPILGVTSFGPLALDIQVLRSHGVVGLIDRNALPETVVDRVYQILGPTGSRRVSERVVCFFPVDVERGGILSQEYALSLSASGMRLSSVEPLEPNTDLQLRFRLPMIDAQLIDAEGRVVHRLSKLNSAGRHEVGVFFYPLDPSHRMIIKREVDRLLSD